MFTRKQIWRRVRSRKYINDVCNNYLEDLPNPYIKENLNKERLLSNSKKLERKFNKENNIKDRVSFSGVVKVVLIPILKDYQEAKLDCKLWYSRDDFFLFQEEYRNELRKGKYNSI